MWKLFVSLQPKSSSSTVRWPARRNRKELSEQKLHTFFFFSCFPQNDVAISATCTTLYNSTHWSFPFLIFIWCTNSPAKLQTHSVSFFFWAALWLLPGCSKQILQSVKQRVPIWGTLTHTGFILRWGCNSMTRQLSKKIFCHTGSSVDCSVLVLVLVAIQWRGSCQKEFFSYGILCRLFNSCVCLIKQSS